jgi:hemerythrin-like domain-containing protein
MTFKDAFNVVKYSAKIAHEAEIICSCLDKVIERIKNKKLNEEEINVLTQFVKNAQRRIDRINSANVSLIGYEISDIVDNVIEQISKRIDIIRDLLKQQKEV